MSLERNKIPSKSIIYGHTNAALFGDPSPLCKFNQSFYVAKTLENPLFIATKKKLGKVEICLFKDLLMVHKDELTWWSCVKLVNC